MTRFAGCVAWIGILCLGIGTAAADPVTITSGSIVLSQPSLFQVGPIEIAGTREFSVAGVVDSGEGSIHPLTQCFPCVPRNNFSVGAALGTSAIEGTATLDGVTYQPINSFSTSNFVFLRLIGTTVLPPVNGPALVIHAPFTVAPGSLFTYEITPGSYQEPPHTATVALAGRGIATVNFLANPTAPVWEFSDMRYDFVPTPEPSTLILVGGGLVATLFRARAYKRQ
jgi:hypothetical protein